MSSDGVVPALVGFNVGVEVGQLGVVLAALPVLALARRSEDADRRLVGAVSLAVAALGAGWTIDRAVGLGWLPGA